MNQQLIQKVKTLRREKELELRNADVLIMLLKEEQAHRSSRMTLQSRNRRLEKKLTEAYKVLTRRNAQLNRMGGFIAKLYAEGRITKDEIAILKQKSVKKNECQG